MAEAVRGVLGAWEEFRIDAVEYRELDDGRVLVLTDRHGRGRTAGWTWGRCGRRERRSSTSAATR
jgi:hypothetical protein